MSHIDSFAHEFVGYFASLPIYHILDACSEEDECLEDPDFCVGPRTLVMGGGSGEHPGLIVNSPTYAVTEYFFHLIKGREEEAGVPENILEALKAIVKTHDYEPRLSFAGWATRHHSEFYTKCQSEALCDPFSEQHDPSFEAWVHISFGDFIYHAFPEMAQCVVNMIQPYMRYWMEFGPNILIAPHTRRTFANKGHAFETVRRHLNTKDAI